MADPILPAIAGAAVAGAGAGVLSALGLEPAPLFWALVGASLGITFAAAASRSRAVTVFVAVALVSSLLGALAAHRWANGEQIYRNGFACLLAIGFHPALNALITRLPEALDGLMKRFGLKKEQP